MKPEDDFREHKAEALMWLKRIELGLKRNAGHKYIMLQLETLRDHLQEWELTEDAAKIWVEYCDRVKARSSAEKNDMTALGVACITPADVDSWAEEAARDRGLQTLVFHANWDGLGGKPGPIRNAEVIAKADEVVAFWDRESRGTLNALVQARDAGLPITILDQTAPRYRSRQSCRQPRHWGSSLPSSAPSARVMAEIARAKHILRRYQRASSEGPCQANHQENTQAATLTIPALRRR